MLIRVGGGHSGIKEYLEKGQKQGGIFHATNSMSAWYWQAIWN